MKRSPRARQKGYLLIAALLALMVMSGLAVGLCYMVNTETNIGYSDEANTRAYYAAEAALEKLTADLRDLYRTKQSPTSSDISALTGKVPNLGGDLEVTNYTIGFEDANGNTKGVTSPVVTAGEVGGTGSTAGLKAQVIKLLATVTARIKSTGQQVELTRELEVALIPVFQFGAFSDEDLAYHPGVDFDFAGRVHTNGNLFLASVNSNPGLIFHDHVSASKQIIRAVLANGLSTSGTGKTGIVRIPKEAAGCEKKNGTNDIDTTTCLQLGLNQGSTQSGPEDLPNVLWASIERTFDHFLDAAAKALSLPFVSGGVPPIELVRRPTSDEASDSYLATSRMYNLAQIRLLIDQSDSALTAGRASVPNTSLKVEIHTAGGSWVDVTSSWLKRGITQADSTAILRFTSSGSNPINLYDAREGEPRENDADADILATSTAKDRRGNLTAPAACSCAGTMNTVELDVAQLRDWLLNDSVGRSTDYVTQNGYVLYFSDQRGMLPNTDVPTKHLDYNRTAGYGFTDVTNPSSASGTPNGKLEAGEALHRLPGYTKDDPLGFEAAGFVGKNAGASQPPLTYGAKNLGDVFGLSLAKPYNPYTIIPNDNKNSQPSCLRAKRAWVSGARHALKLVHGSLGSLPKNPATQEGGFTVASENPVYVQGNYNADGPSFDDSQHAAAAIIADTVTLLSNNWDDAASFDYPRNSLKRRASETYYRMAVAAGTSLAYPHPSWTDNNEVGLDGGVHNFLRYLEDWNGLSSYYRGSLVVLFPAQYGTGTYKNGHNMVYRPPSRHYSFDSDFLELNKLPPGTPSFKDVINLSFKQNFKPQ